VRAHLVLYEEIDERYIGFADKLIPLFVSIIVIKFPSHGDDPKDLTILKRETKGAFSYSFLDTNSLPRKNLNPCPKETSASEKSGILKFISLGGVRSIADEAEEKFVFLTGINRRTDYGALRIEGYKRVLFGT